MKRRYVFFRGIIRLLSPKMTTEWAEPFDGAPAVFCPNHAGAFGPIDMCAHFPMSDELHPWFNHDVAEPKLIPAYVRQDYWWKPGCRLEWLYNATLPYLAAVLLPPIMTSVPGVKVYHDARVIKTIRQSMDYLRKGEHLIIFAQQPSGYQSHLMELNRGFLQIAPVAWRTLNMALNFYPVRIDYKHRKFYVAKPIRFDPARTLKEQENEIVDYISANI